MIELLLRIRLTALALLLRLSGKRLRAVVWRWIQPIMERLVRRAVRTDPGRQACIVLKNTPCFKFQEDAMVFLQLHWKRDEDAQVEFLSLLFSRQRFNFWEKGPAVAFLTEKYDRDAPTSPKRIIFDDHPMGMVWVPGTHLLVIQREG